MATFVRLLGWLRPYRRGVVLSRAARGGRDGHDGRHPVAHRPRHRPDPGAATGGPDDARRSSSSPRACCAWRSPSRAGWSPGASRSASSSTCATRMYGHLQALELGFFDRQQTGQLMSRATVDLQAVRFFLGYGLVFILQSALTILLAAVAMFAVQPGLAAIVADPGPVRGRRRRALRPARAPGAAGGPAAHRRADRRRRGEHLRRARRQGLRARGAPARALPRARRARLRPVDARPRACRPSTTRSSASCPSSAWPRSCSSAGARSSTGADPRRVHRLLRLPAHAAVADAHARHACSGSPSARPRPAPASSRSSTASRGSSRRPSAPALPAGHGPRRSCAA